jgi:hypothetical protein
VSRDLDAGAAAFAAGRLDEAAMIYRRAERRAPGDFRATYSLAIIDLNRGRLTEGRRRLKAVVAREPGLFMAWHNLGAVSRQLGDWRMAADSYARAAALRPDSLDTLDGLATALAALGRIDEAVAQHRALAAAPASRWRALTRIALLRPQAIGDSDLEDMAAAVAEPRIDADTRTGLWFALGEVLEGRGRGEEAFAAYAAGNRLRREGLGPAVAEAAAANATSAQFIARRFDAAHMSANVGGGHPSAAPIFIVGFPRSGSTLIEQILASHPEVQGLGETGVLPRLADEAPPGRFRDLAESYLAELRERGWDGASRFVDKTLENYLHVGLIRLTFPNAMILHSTRDPIDTGYACWRQVFTSGNETLYDFGDIAAEYRRYQGLMDHWAAVTPGAVVDVCYEALVADPETQIRALIDTAGLPWDPACLRFFEREGAVGTASAAQVRRPIYADSIDRWRPHAKALAPLIEGLKA